MPELFKESFKKYKSKCPPPDFSEVINFGSKSSSQIEGVKNGKIVNPVHLCGLQPVSQWKISEIENNPGMIHVVNPFTDVGHRYWVCRALSSYTQRPESKLSLDGIGDLQEDEDWWELCTRDAFRAKHLQPGLRWATMGYHHNWNTKIYSEEERDAFPGDLAALSQCIANAVGYSDFCAEAAIVNFYHKNSALAGHTDHSERNLEAPLLSFSFGCSAVFLIGGKTLETKPTAMFLHSGDLVIMAGESRLCYHSVPKILPTSENLSEEVPCCSPCKDCCCILDADLFTKCSDNEFWEPFKKYIEKSRINLNVRQVLYPGETKLISET
ncbi:Putative alkylated DNA repair protein alkB-like protein 1 [Gryllus bimaculatus]|nr:Putative alkylated DNA repair protein alkB-like protein 1 [Gryllus bimaculatus]